MNYEEKYKDAQKWIESIYTELSHERQLEAEAFFPELAESEDDRIRKEIKQFIKQHNGWNKEWIDWLEKQCECVIDCPQNHQDSNRPSAGIVLEDFNGGEGFYKLNLAYLNKKQIEEVEELVREWNNEPSTSEEDIKDCIGMCLTDADEQRFENYHTNLRDCLAWLDKQGEHKPIKVEKPSSNWSEEDVNMCESVIDVLFNNTMSESKGREVYSKEIEWLKSLKERLQSLNNWKPLIAQIEAIEHFYISMGESGFLSPYDRNTQLLYSLLMDLKKLKEQ